MDRNLSGQPHNELDAAVARLAASQFSVFSRAQVVALGATPAQIEHRLAMGRWVLLLRNVYGIAGAPPSPRGRR